MANYDTWNNLSAVAKIASVNANATHLTSGYKHNTSTVTYSFLTQDDGRVFQPYVPAGEPTNFESFSSYEKAFTRTIIDYLEGFLNIDFQEVSGSAGTLGFGRHNMDAGGYADYPGISKQAVYISNARVNNSIGDYGLGSIVHELGHALGLSHPNEYTVGAAERLDFDIDTSALTIMSYNNAYYTDPLADGFFTFFGLLDIEALINIYGVKPTFEHNTYSLNMSGDASKSGTTWDVPIAIPFALADSGGYDIIDASTMSLSDVSSALFDFSQGLFLDKGQLVQINSNETGEWIDLTTSDKIAHLQIHQDTIIEEYIGTSLGETVVGNSAAQSIKTGGGVDIITGAGGDDTIDGGSGEDTVKYDGSATQFSITLNKGAATSILDRKGDAGTDNVVNVENIDFLVGAKDVDLDILDGVVNVSEADLTVFIEMYIAYFNRAPDAEGLFYWGTRLSEGMELSQIAKSFFVQPETVALYPDPNDTSGFVTSVYNNFLGRAPDAEGFAYWVNELDTGSISRDIFMLAIINGAKADTGSPADVDYITGKAKVGSYFSVIKGMSNTDNAKSAMALYDGSDAGLAAAKSAVDGYYSSAIDANSGELLIKLVGVMDDPFIV
ncbi:DUF4214 domain-containing protein [Maritalea porphyrae]|uniref:Peptidase metallopeptidase domain-containing protein n=1 Tax=Maritalea porphyrae TaxID=880732 RepID=A0ABQ5UQF3_9HYPH|nr:DUF4214 domain-containing protein [Maritalea porphyrae]GLQ16550.1 hypothetical protein GCM10007879_07990 [Maritalea porphyrae]